jgi:hypothetical protein
MTVQLVEICVIKYITNDETKIESKKKPTTKSYDYHEKI